MKRLLSEPLFCTLTLSGLILIGAAAVMLHPGQFLHAAGHFLHAMRPLLFGVLFATMLRPSYERLRTDFQHAAVRHGGAPDAAWIRVVSLTGAMLPPVLILASVICVLIPQLMQSVRLLSDHLGLYADRLGGISAGYGRSKLAQWMPAAQFAEWLSRLQEMLPALLRKTYDYTASAVRLLLDIGIGVVFSLYLLAEQRCLRAQMVRLLGVLVPEARLPAVLRRLRQTCEMFARFLLSQCKESLILGVLCWCGMAVLGFPYPVLISVVIGVTNIVPYFGPLVGIVPSALLMLLVRPGAVIWFILYVVVLQQVESNFIYPRVIGKSTGLPPAWVLAAITLGGGLFGVTGMLLGVPAAAAVYAFVIGETS